MIQIEYEGSRCWEFRAGDKNTSFENSIQYFDATA